MAVTLDTEKIREAYDGVRDDHTDTSWALFKYRAGKITLDCVGSDYDDFQDMFKEDDRAFGYVRLTTGDEMSVRTKFAFIVWIGPDVSPIKRAKVSSDAALLKSIVSNFVVEIQASEQEEIALKSVRDLVAKAGGANYGTGQRKSLLN